MLPSSSSSTSMTTYSSYVVQCLAILPIFDQSEAQKLSHIDTQTESTYCQTLLYEQRLQKSVHFKWTNIKPDSIWFWSLDVSTWALVWCCIVLYGPAFSFIVLYSLIWPWMVLCGLVWFCMVSYCPVWSCIIFDDPVWFCMVLHVIVWFCMDFYCSVWPCIVLFRPVRNCTVNYGSVLPYMGVCDPAWLIHPLYSLVLSCIVMFGVGKVLFHSI